MSELKVYHCNEWHNEYTEFYLKSEVDKVIARHKYKRCLAIVERCNDNIENQGQYDEHDDWLIITEYWERWRKRWLALAEKFKEAK